MVLLVLTAFVAGCGRERESNSGSSPSTKSGAAASLFSEVAAKRGLNWSHSAGAYDSFPMPQIMGSGCAFLDANGDDLLDVLLVGGVDQSSSEEPEDSTSSAVVSLFLQNQDGEFEDHSATAGMLVNGYGMGATTGDFDNDGNVDVLITTTSGPVLFRNDGDGRFVNVTERAGLESQRWSSAAAFTDYDRDGWLDLLIVNYVDYFPGSICEDGTGRRDYCGPLAFSGTTDRLYRNLGGSGSVGLFLDTTIASGLALGAGKGLGAVCTDMTGDGRVDFYIANDQEPNRLWVQRPNQTFRDEAELRGCATDIQGRPQASMGSTWCDLDADGKNDLFLTHLRGEMNTFYKNIAPGLFVDQTGSSGLGSGTLNFTGFGVAAPDINLDGNRDVVVANGRVMRAPLLSPIPAKSHWSEYAERNQVFLGSDSGQFRELSTDREPFTSDALISRGLATGDFDKDGDVDILISNVNGPSQLFENIGPRSGHWLTVRLFDPVRKRDSIGASVTLSCGSRRWHLELNPNNGYQSSHDMRLHFGTGGIDRFNYIDVIWPDGDRETERFPGGPLNSHLILRRGQGGRQSNTRNASDLESDE